MSILAKNICLSRGGKRILSDVSFSTGDTRVFILFGPSGSGKTTLLRLLNRLDEPDEGEIEIFGKPVRDFVPTDLRRRVGMIFQVPSLLHGSVEEVVGFGAHYHHIPVDIPGTLAQVGLGGYAARDVRDLSGGERQRVAIARALVVKPEILLMDEPTGSLDRRAVLQIEDLLVRLSTDENLKILLVTHDRDQARRLGGRGAFLSGGRVVHVGDLSFFLEEQRV